jgi:hypothetical protein
MVKKSTENVVVDIGNGIMPIHTLVKVSASTIVPQMHDRPTARTPARTPLVISNYDYFFHTTIFLNFAYLMLEDIQS